MANETSVRSYRDFDAYNRTGASDEAVRKDAAGDPLAELARIMGQDDNYADLLKSVARTRGEPALRRQAEEGNAPAPGAVPQDQAVAEAAEPAVADWDDLEAELESYVRSGQGARPRGEAEQRAAEAFTPLYDDALDDEVVHHLPHARQPAEETHVHGLRGSYSAAPGEEVAPGSLRDLERMLADNLGRQNATYQAEAAAREAEAEDLYQSSAYQPTAREESLYREHGYQSSAYQATGYQAQVGAASYRDDDARVAEAFADDRSYAAETTPRQPAGYGTATAAGAGMGVLAAAAWRGRNAQAQVPDMVASQPGGRTEAAYGENGSAAYGNSAYLPAAERAASDPVFVEDGHMAQPDPQVFEEAPPRRRRAGVTTVMAIVGLAVAGGGGVLGYKALTGGSSASGEARVVRANNDPVRMPAAQGQDAKPVTDRAPGADRLVAREERPISQREQAAQVQTPAAPVAPRVIPLTPAAPAQAAANPAEPVVRQVQSVPVPGANTAPAQVLRPAAQDAPTATASAAPRGTAEEPRRVRTVAVGPDNQIVSPAARPAAAPAPSQPLSVVPNQPASADAAPTPAPRPSRAARPAETHDAAAGSRPIDLAPQRTASVRQPPAAAPAPAAGGSSFVQISSHQSEAEARNAFASAQRRFPALQGQSPSIRQAELPGRGTWYRLRVGPFSRSDAQSFCERLKASGGSCVIN